MSPKAPDPTLPDRVVDAAVHLMAEEGRRAVTARRLAREVGASTMAVYTHFGSMDDVYRHVMRRGFHAFGAELSRGRVSDDAVADWMAQGWGYRRFALREPELYQVMFGEGLAGFKLSAPEDFEAAMGPFIALLDRIEACVAAGRWQVEDVQRAGEAVWAASHGHAAIELTGYFHAMGRDPVASFGEIMQRLSVGFGDAPADTAHSLATARRRAARVDRAEADGR